MSTRPRHKNKHIEAAVQAAEKLGWRVELSNGHAWGILLCGFQQRGGCRMSIWSTPRNPQAHARDILRFVAACKHKERHDGQNN